MAQIKKNTDIESVLIFGGAGFLGHHLISSFYNETPRPKIHIADLRPLENNPSPSFYPWTLKDITVHKVDITDSLAVENLIANIKPKVIVHSVSPIHGIANKQIYYEVNVNGTQNIVDSAKKFSTAISPMILIYTSSAGVIFDGSDLINADESYPIPVTPMDAYNDSKALGEHVVLEANSQELLTAALRPAGIFGPGDRQLVPGMLRVLSNHQTKAQLGDNNNLFDFTYVGNVADAHLTAAKALLQVNFLKSDSHYGISNGSNKNKSLSPGQFYPSDPSGLSYFITNATPIPFFTMPRAIWAHRGHVDNYYITIPRSLAFILGALSEFAGYLTNKEPSFTRFRVAFACANRYYNISRAKSILNYEPKVSIEDGIKLTLDWLDEEASLSS